MKKVSFLFCLLLFISMTYFSLIGHAEANQDRNGVNTFNVSTEAELKRALNSIELKTNDIISINKSIEISQPIEISKIIKIEGNGNYIHLKDTVKAGYIFKIENITGSKDCIFIENIRLKGNLDVTKPQVELKEGGV